MPIIPLDIVHDLVKLERSVAAFVVYTYIWSLADADGLTASLQAIGQGTGFSKSTVQKALRILNQRNLVRSERSVHYLVTA
ncbi:MAG TPA: helix-turn-helix domain-containing protein [Thermoanaerobaculia bacterium]|nr:helix-turn-helix domain-containing protein [Thermoanaerobaculia bacterium]